MGQPTREQVMHRRAQNAEGAVQSALFEIASWRSVLEPRKPDFWLARKVLDDIERSLNRLSTPQPNVDEGDGK